VTDDRPGVRAHWARVNSLFHRALEVDPDAREAFIAGEAGSDAVLAGQVRSLVEAHGRTGEFLDVAAAAPDELDRLARAMPVSGRTIGPYRVQRVIGEGGSGVVYLAEDTRLGRTVALKALAPPYAGDASRIERLRREARAAALLSDPGIATVFALDQIDGQWYLAYEYVPGNTLRDELRRGPLGVARALGTGLAIARALAAAHALGIVHRDLKPENVMLAPDGRVKVLDFGLAQVTGTNLETSYLTETGTILGTPAYMAPEQIRGGHVDARADVFALGIVIAELATGHHPFHIGAMTATLASILHDEPRRITVADDPAASRATLAALDRVVQTCLQKPLDQRFQSVSDVVDALEKARTGVQPLEPGRSSAADPGSPGAFWWWQFHQASTSLVYALLLWPVWHTRPAGDEWGLRLFLIGLVAVVIACAVRLHLWFAARLYPDDWPDQHHRSRRWIRAADITFTTTLVAAGLRAGTAEGPAVLLVAAAAGVAVSFAVIEPATTRAAFGRSPGPPRP